MRFLLIALAMLLPISSHAADQNQDEVMSCVAEMDKTTTWDQCRKLIFIPCEEMAVGSGDHIQCLTERKSAWFDEMDGYKAEVKERITPDSAIILNDLMKQWVGYVSEKCEAVGKARAGISEEAARSGCEISEIVGITVEFKGCLEGVSQSPYCTLKN